MTELTIPRDSALDLQPLSPSCRTDEGRALAIAR